VRRPASLVLAAVFVVVAMPGFAGAQTPPGSGPEPRDQIVLSGDVAVPRGRAVGEVVVFDGTVTVHGVVRGDVVVLSGKVAVSGQVGGSVIVVDGSVSIGASGQVGEDVLAGGDVTLEPGATVGGDARRFFRLSLARPLEVLGILLASASVAFSSLVLGLLLLLLAPRGIDRTAEALREAPVASVAWGIGLWLLVPVASVVAIATVVGIPAGLAMLLGLGLVVAFGYTLAVCSLGRWMVPAPRGRLGAFLAGWGISVVLGLVPFLNVAWWLVASVAGLGGATVAAWRARGTGGSGRHRPDREARTTEQDRHPVGSLDRPLAGAPDPTPAND
jgi:hypothetical protein